MHSPKASDHRNRDMKIRQNDREKWLVVLVLVVAISWGGCSSPQPIEAPPIAIDFDESLYGIWEDADQDCQDTSQEVLIKKSWGGVTLSSNRCRVLEGTWFDPFTGQTLNDTRGIAVDHFISLPEVHRSGGEKWSKARRREYGNDMTNPETLVVVSLSTKQERSGLDPADWIPPNPAVRCEYIRIWKQMKQKWELTMDAREQAVVQWMSQKCGLQ